jgi:dihydroorotate dehydrogenase (NAD+) catalytic subunit
MSVALRTAVGSVPFANPVLTASGTAGHGAELAAYGPLDRLGAVVVKSLSFEPWPGNPPPRLTEVGESMLNSVGLSGPGVEAWLREDLPALRAAGATVVASIWGRRVEDFAAAARALAGAAESLAAVEVNVSCPNIEDRARMFAHSPTATFDAVTAAECGLPRWVKLSPNVADLSAIAEAAQRAGAAALTLVNTVLGMAIDVEARRPVLGAGGGGLSGPPLRAVAVRALYECHRALPDMPLVGVGGVFSGVDAVELLLAGASAVEVGTATFRDPRAPWRVLRELEAWCDAHGVAEVTELIGAAHG